MNRCTHDKCFHDDDDGGHRPTDQDEKNRHIHTRVRDVCTKSRRHVGEEGGETGDKESKSVCIKQQGKTHMITAEELKNMIAEDEAYFVYNGRVLKIGEVSGLRHNVLWQETRVTHLYSTSVDVQETVRTLPWQRRNRDPHQTHVREWIGFSSGSILGTHVGNIIQLETTPRRQRRDMFICNHAESNIDPSISDTTDYVPINIPDEPQTTQLYILEDTSSVIQMSSKGRAPTLRPGPTERTLTG